MEENSDLNVLVIMLIVVCLASVNCERGFSIMNIIKHILSNRMRVSLVSAIMSIKDSDWTITGDLMENEDKILTEFKSQKERRGEYNK